MQPVLRPGRWRKTGGAWLNTGESKGERKPVLRVANERGDRRYLGTRGRRHRRKPADWVRRGKPRPDATSTGYTIGMKTAVSIPDEVFEKVERLARREGRSRSEVFSAALAEYVARHAPDEVTDAMNRVCAEVGDQPDGFVTAAGRRVLERTEW